MRRSNVWTIFRREVRDQLRDRRTLFMIFVLPLLLYPILGIVIVQFATAFEQKPRTVVLLGAEHLPPSPPLLNATRDGFDSELFDLEAEARRLQVQVEPASSPWADPNARRIGVNGGQADAVVEIPADIGDQLEREGRASIAIVHNSADEPSQITYLRVREVLARWNEKIVAARLARDNKPDTYTEPVRTRPVDVATPEQTGGSVWARIFPFLLVMMSLTGAFYPAVDLCAGEKERGTMETLLISPASRSEIVMGKFLTVMLASILTALLNLVSMGLTGLRLAGQVGTMAASGNRQMASVIAPPSLSSAVWIILLLIPLAAFFSAICLALAVLAKSMKEGQYYMTPLYLVALPLIFLTLTPGIELNLFYSLVPITGVALLLKSLLQGDFYLARTFFLPVLLPTMVYGALALRWSIEQFKREDVLFRESERFELGLWLRHLFRDKGPVPTGGEALLCFILMLTSAWFVIQFLATSASSFTVMAAGQVAFILTPPLAMAFLLTSDPIRTLRLRWPSPRYFLLAAGLAVALNPLVRELGIVVEYLFPTSQTVKDLFAQMTGSITNVWTALLLFALIPAVCEEVAFRGYILSGLESGFTRREAILLSSLLFGFMHVLLSLFQQLFNATLLGLVLGVIAVRSGSLLPGILFHLINNGLAVVMGNLSSDPSGKVAAGWLYRDAAEGLYHWPWIVLGAVASATLLVLLRREPTAGESPEPEAVAAEAVGNPPGS